MRRPDSRFASLAGAVALASLFAGAVVGRLGRPNQMLIVLAGLSVLAVAYLPSIFVRAHRAAQPVGLPVELLGCAGAIGLPLAVAFGSVSSGAVARTGAYVASLALLVYLILLLVAHRTRPERGIGFRGSDVAVYGAGLALLAANLPLPIQLPDPRFRPSLSQPAYAKGQGPVVHVDAGHHNFHTLDGRYRGFARVLEDDGYRPVPSRAVFAPGTLAQARILVVANALHRMNVDRWDASPPSAFTDAEVRATEKWVREGGALLLIADHRPFAGAAADLAGAFGFVFFDGFAARFSGGADEFTRAGGALADTPVSNGRAPEERVYRVRTFVGQAISIPPDATSVLRLGAQYRLWPSADAWRRRLPHESISAEQCAQLAYKTHGMGRVVVAGEAGMFSAQLDMGLSFRPLGMNAPGAQENQQLLLNVIHWLDRKIG